MKILALDIASTVGVAFGSSGSAPRSATVNLGKGRFVDAPFARLLRLTNKLITEFDPDLVVYEAPVGGPRTSHVLVGLAACFVGEANRLGHEPDKLNIQAVRKFFLGRVPVIKDFPDLNPRDAKLAIKRLVVARCHGLGWAPRNADEADACALFAHASATHAGASFPPPGGLFHA